MSAEGDSRVTAGVGRREQLLQAAREVLAINGYERTTVSSIATRANVAQGTFYLYFPSKEALPGALAAEVSRDMGLAARAAAEQPSFPAGLEALVAGSFEVGDAYRDVLLIANRGFELCEDFDGFLELTADWREGLETFLNHFQEAGEVERDIDVATTSYLLRDLLDRAAKARVLFGQQSYADATVNLLRRALAA